MGSQETFRFSRWGLWAGLAAAVCLGGSPTPALERIVGGVGASASYLANSSDPGIGLSWVQSGFDDSGWPVGALGIGYEDGDFPELVDTIIPGGTLSLYTRITFDVTDVSVIDNLFFATEFDDGGRRPPPRAV